MGRGAHILVVGNEKGGSGKSTTAMHLIAAFLEQGLRVGSLDVDARQGTLTRYIANRKRFNAKRGRDYPMPDHHTMAVPGLQGYTAQEMAEEEQKLKLRIEGLMLGNDVVVVDTPGSANPLSLLAHSYADTLITPLNDSFVDLDVLAHLEVGTAAIKGPSQYAELVWEAKKRRADRGDARMDWIVMRNRLSQLATHNKRDMAGRLDALAKSLGFRHVAGFGERVIFRELFLVGLTILDLRDEFGPQSLTASHLAAREEVRRLAKEVRFLPAAALAN